MASRPTKISRLTIDVTSEIRQQVKMRAATENTTMSQWILGLIIDELDEDEDIRVALERLNDLAGSISFKGFRQELLKIDHPNGP
jgi:hypothetical protein